MSSARAVVLLSGGLDSSFNLFKARQNLTIGLALTFNYGQRAARRELTVARRLAAKLGVSHQVIDLPWFREFTRTSLVAADTAVPVAEEVSIDDRQRSLESAKRVWVPNRNGILLNIAAGFAEGIGATYVIPGFNLEEAQTFPDNGEAFMRSLDQAFSYSTANGVRAHCYSIQMDKTAIVREGRALGLPFAELWPCYFDGEKWCGTCESCQRYRRALTANGLSFDDLNDQERPSDHEE